VAGIPSGSAAPDGCRDESLRCAKRLCGPFGNVDDGAPVNPGPTERCWAPGGRPARAATGRDWEAGQATSPG
jgi:hypothetical protein